jgi:hypothetical protein
MQGEDREQLVAVECTTPNLVAEDTPVAVAVVGDAQPRAVQADGGAHRLRVLAAEPGIDVLSVWLVAKAPIRSAP